MFAALKKETARRKLARKAHTVQFRARIAELNEKAEIETALIQVEKDANKANFREKLDANNRMLAEAWSK